MDEITIVFITLGINIAYQLIHYSIRKLSECQEIDFFCFKLKRDNNSSITNKRSSESDKDGITEISIK